VLTATSGSAQAIRTVYVASSTRPVAQTPFVRTRDCLGPPHACVNGDGGRELVYLVAGRMPTKATSAVVLTDTNCNPDSYGISHCSNMLKLAGGRVITVRHDHSMANDPCLAPGEVVGLRVLG
jgi:hypothetical protein